MLFILFYLYLLLNHEKHNYMKKRIFTALIILSIVFSFENNAHSQSKFQIDYYSNFSAVDLDIFTGVKKTSTGYAMAGMVSGINLPLIQSGAQQQQQPASGHYKNGFSQPTNGGQLHGCPLPQVSMQSCLSGPQMPDPPPPPP